MLDDPPILAFLKRLLEPALLLTALYVSIMVNGQFLNGSYLLLMILVFFVSSFVYDQLEIYRNADRWKTRYVGLDIFLGWIIIVGVLTLIGKATGLVDEYPTQVLIPWVFAAPVALLVTRLVALRFFSRSRQASAVKSAVIVGSNDTGATLHERIVAHAISGIEVLGFFDDRDHSRQASGAIEHHIGNVADAGSYVREHHVNFIFISMPMSAQPRLLALLDELKDTTASIYFVPDIQNFEMMQARIDDVGGLPVVGICESPFTGLNSAIKRASDLVIASLIQIALAPIMLLIAIGVKLSSPGPVIFAQRRYGLDGEEIMVYKFRSMTVCEDGGKIAQATKNDRRVTKFGAFLRRTSLDELPQFFNVLQGRMSVVGPRPHAVAHNEQYRGQIKGYMQRHKVKPGITGWAQVNGLRGETETLDKMQARIEFDLDYLRRWSLLLDLQIIARTVGVILKKENAY